MTRLSRGSLPEVGVWVSRARMLRLWWMLSDYLLGKCQFRAFPAVRHLPHSLPHATPSRRPPSVGENVKSVSCCSLIFQRT